jgi:hypothetical protein
VLVTRTVSVRPIGAFNRALQLVVDLQGSGSVGPLDAEEVLLTFNPGNTHASPIHSIRLSAKFWSVGRPA